MDSPFSFDDIQERTTEHPERVIDPQMLVDERSVDLTLRPNSLDDFIGQTKVKENLRIFLEAAKQRGESCEHLLFYGPPGLGKTSLAHVIAKEMNANIKVTSGPALERVGDLAAILSGLEAGDILFIDEIHRMNRSIEEILYPAMEDFALDIIIGKGPTAHSVRLDLKRFTLIGATTRLSLLGNPLRDRFGHLFHLDFYTVEDMTEILRRSASLLGIQADEDALRMIAARSRRTPRIGNRLLRRVRDFAQVQGTDIHQALTHHALERIDIDHRGLDEADRRILRILIENFSGGPAGLSTLAASAAEEIATVEEVIEPFLLQEGFLTRTPRGRIATAMAYTHLNFTPPT
ncbi:MAG: holliday junction helicase RuvB [Patescibacteria group bacterium]|nr:holliday junction helicase RuvB [Patescibacteria group bacterium]